MAKVIVNPARSIVCRWHKARCASAVYGRVNAKDDDRHYIKKRYCAASQVKMAQTLHHAGGAATPAGKAPPPTVAHM